MSFMIHPGDGRSRELAFEKGEDEKGGYITFTVPELAYWDMIYMSGM